MGGIVGVTGLISYQGKNDELQEGCEISPRETKGPFPNKTPLDYVRENIIGDRKGIALLMHFKILDKKNGCLPLKGAIMDVWHCDSHGNYSEYSGFGMQEDMTKENFLRGRQTADANGVVSFISIFPGHYRGRAPHVHLEVFNANASSLLVTQIAFPSKICDTVYATSDYQGGNYISNERDGIFRDSLDKNMIDSITGNIKDGYTLSKTVVV